ncbi:gp38 domain protein [Burkholderia pseudomallei]|uniref:hypothetical protein n=1 Tax=Burkholderia pseudomallei TaxID=28450 RepID=UPI00052A1438|nr:hypothetical protein [Burkholderia pseudomallei]AIV76773.1 gp38 domain protein [Burkholderia pseudomallei]
MKKSEVLPAAAPADVRAAIQGAYDWLTTLGFPEILPVMRNLRGLLDAPQPAQADERAACTHQWTWADGKCADCGASTKQPTPTGGMTLGERIAHVGGRVTEDGTVEFGSVMALDALVQHVLRDTGAAASPGAEAVALTDEGIIQLFEEKADVDLEVYHGIAASTVLSFARALLAAPQPAQADAPAHAAECPHCDGEGVIESDSGTSPCACQWDAQEGMPTFGQRKVQADEPARAMTMEDGYLIQWLRFIGQAPFECDPSIIARRLLSAKATEEEKHLVAELIDKWARAYVKRFPK